MSATSTIHPAGAIAPIGVRSAGDLVQLVKPRIMVMALLTAAGGLALAPGTPAAGTWLALMLGTGLIVGAANTLNMYLERDIDCLMARTRNRPLPARRLAPIVALVFGVAQALIAVPVLTFAIPAEASPHAGPLTGALGVLALICYVMMYTPLKQRTTASTLIGSVPGAMPALMGWTAATGAIELGGLAVFAVLFVWQIPHFHAIALFRHKEYQRAGLKTLPGERGDAAARRAIVAYLVVQLAVSVWPYYLGVTGIPYLVVALLFGVPYLAYGVYGLRTAGGPRWARRVFLISIVYLPAVFIALVAGGVG